MHTFAELLPRLLGLALFALVLIVVPYVYMVWKLYRSFPCLGKPIPPAPLALAPPSDPRGYEIMQASLGELLVPEEIPHRKIVFDAEKHPDVGFMLSLWDGESRRTVVSVSALPRIQPVSFLPLLSWWKFDFSRSFEWALRARWWLPALVFKAFLVGRYADVGVVRLQTPALKGFLRQGRRFDGAFLEFHLFSAASYYTLSFIGFEGLLTEEQVQVMAASFTPAKPNTAEIRTQ